jgi:hypothetical protein
MMSGNIFGFYPVDLSVTPASQLVHVGFAKVNAIAMYNHGTSLAVLRLFDLGRVPILGTDAHAYEFACPFTSMADQGTNQFCPTFVAGLKFVNGLSYALVTAFGGATLLGASIVTGTIDWEIRP